MTSVARVPPRVAARVALREGARESVVFVPVLLVLVLSAEVAPRDRQMLLAVGRLALAAARVAPREPPKSA